MLAGQVRLKTFLAFVAGAVLCGGGGLAALSAAGLGSLVMGTSGPENGPPTVEAQSVSASGVPSQPALAVPAVPADAAPPVGMPGVPPAAVGVGLAAGAPAGAGQGVSEADTVALSYRGKAIGSDKLKDVTTGRPYKVNVYQDAGKPTANRAKADLDRDDKWDLKYTFDGDTVTRDVAPADDENYTVHEVFRDGGWVAR